MKQSGNGNIKPAGQMLFDHVHLVLQAVEDGLGFAAVPVSLVSHDIALGRLCCLLPDQRVPITRYYYAIGPNVAPDAQHFLEWLVGEGANPSAI